MPSEEFRLRNYSTEDVPLLVEYLNNANVTRYLSTRIPQPYTLEDALWWVNEGSGQGIVKAIEVGGIFAGTIGVTPGAFEHSRSAEIGYWLGEEHWGKGLATAAVVTMSELVFKTTGVVRLHAPVFSENTASQRVLEKCGFSREAIQHKALYKHGCFHDAYVFSRVRD